MSNMQNFETGMYLLPKEGGMRVPGLVVASETLLHQGDIEKPLEQVRNVAYLPGIVGYSIAMPIFIGIWISNWRSSCYGCRAWCP